MPHPWRLGVLAIAFLSCRDGRPEEPRAKDEAAPRASAASLVAEGRGAPRLADPMDLVRARGPLHAPPLHLDATSVSPERWLAIIGNPDMARAAWVVTPSSGELHPIDDWPVGVRVVGSVVRHHVPYLLLESVALLDQPAGMRAVWSDSFGEESPLTLAPPSLLDGVADLDDLDHRLDAPREPAPDAPLAWTLRTALRSDAALAAAISREGVEFVERWQGIFARTRGAATPEQARARAAEVVRAAAPEALAQDGCEGDACEAWTARGRVALGFAAETQGAQKKWVVRRVEEDAPMPEIDHTRAPRSVPRSAREEATRAVLREHARTTRAVLGEAPLDPAREGSSIGVALTDDEGGPLAVVVKDGAYARVFDVDAFSGLAAEAEDARDEPARWDVRFADVDGDGRTDALVRASGRASDGVDESVQVALLAPPPSVQADEIRPDLATALPLVDAPTLDAAVDAALAVPRRGVDKEQACKLLGSVRWPSALEDLRAMSAPDAKVLFFEEPSLPTWRARVVPVAKLTAAEVREAWGRDVNPYWAAQHCKELACDAARPLCRYVDGSLYAAYWFDWKKDGALQLSGAAFLL